MSTGFGKCRTCGILVIIKDGYPQPHSCEKVISEKRANKEKD